MLGDSHWGPPTGTRDGAVGIKVGRSYGDEDGKKLWERAFEPMLIEVGHVSQSQCSINHIFHPSFLHHPAFSSQLEFSIPKVFRPHINFQHST